MWYYFSSFLESLYLPILLTNKAKASKLADDPEFTKRAYLLNFLKKFYKFIIFSFCNLITSITRIAFFLSSSDNVLVVKESNSFFVNLNLIIPIRELKISPIVSELLPNFLLTKIVGISEIE